MPEAAEAVVSTAVEAVVGAAGVAEAEAVSSMVAAVG